MYQTHENEIYNCIVPNLETTSIQRPLSEFPFVGLFKQVELYLSMYAKEKKKPIYLYMFLNKITPVF